MVVQKDYLVVKTAKSETSKKLIIQAVYDKNTLKDKVVDA